MADKDGVPLTAAPVAVAEVVWLIVPEADETSREADGPRLDANVVKLVDDDVADLV